MTDANKSSSAMIGQQDYKVFCKFLQERCGIVLGDDKEYLVESRLKRLMQEVGVVNLTQVIAMLNNNLNSEFQAKIVDAMTTNETSWFRDSYPYDAIKEVILPGLNTDVSKTVRIWSAACSSGQEPYSISIVADEYMRSNPGRISDVQIIATDISDSMLKDARSGEYDLGVVTRGLSDERKRHYFAESDSKITVNQLVASKIIFKELNLLQNFSSLGTFDAVFCRNVLIYFSAQIKQDILGRIADTLRPGGFLILGGSESIVKFTDRFETFKINGGLLYRRII